MAWRTFWRRVGRLWRAWTSPALSRRRSASGAPAGGDPAAAPLRGGRRAPICAPEEALAAAGAHRPGRRPAAAVLKVFDAVHGLEPSLLSDPSKEDLAGYLSVLKRLEEALRFLSENCGLAIQWLEDIVEYLEENSVADRRYLLALKASLLSLSESKDPLDGGLLGAALERLEAEFRRLLAAAETIVPPSSAVEKTHPILERLSANGRLENCIKIFVEVRASNIQASLNALDLQYLEISPRVQRRAEHRGHISQWGKHLEFAVKHLFEAEYRLCSDIFEQCGPPEVWTGCFAEIAKRAGILAFLQFGRTVADSKKDPIKLLKLLDIFASLNKLRLDFNRLFGCKPCEEIQKATRDLIKKVVDGACEIFWELLVQVELQREMPPPADGNVPRLVSFMTDYCNRLLGEEYRTILTQAVLDIIRALEQNLQVWSKAYEDATLSHVFLMNTHWHLYKHLKCTKVGELLGEAWLREHDQCKDLQRSLRRDAPATVRLGHPRQGPAREDLPSHRAGHRPRLPELHAELRPSRGAGRQRGKYAKYTAQSLEDLLGSLFQLRPVRSTSLNPRHTNGNLSGVVTATQYKFAPTVA
ncbi:unnamed protein product [Spirodela intermedia]|uniref:Exocyst subunit Exo70 family protein n=1 Tax=Spirodela intermedia TaxID=51605 RepID=A0A7I8JKN9_SPIIN|nr:unnamed protein product [Spirodela intermedia]CAA6670345.1 unnamed protein product [Spirodela intermedia]